MTKQDMLKYQLTHNRAGNGFACVQFDPEGDPRFIRVMSDTLPHKESNNRSTRINNNRTQYEQRTSD